MSLYCTVRHCLPRIWTVGDHCCKCVAPLLAYGVPLGYVGEGFGSELQLSQGKRTSSFTALLSSSCQCIRDMQGLKQSHTSFGR